MKRLENNRFFALIKSSRLAFGGYKLQIITLVFLGFFSGLRNNDRYFLDVAQIGRRLTPLLGEVNWVLRNSALTISSMESHRSSSLPLWVVKRRRSAHYRTRRYCDPLLF